MNTEYELTDEQLALVTGGFLDTITNPNINTITNANIQPNIVLFGSNNDQGGSQIAPEHIFNISHNNI